MSHWIQFSAEDRPAILERVLQTARVRGYAIRSLEVKPQAESGFQVTLRVTTERAIEQLERRLNKIQGIAAVHALSTLNQTEPDTQAPEEVSVWR